MKNILTLFLIFIFYKAIISGSSEEIILPTSIYKNSRYINCYKIPNSIMNFTSNGNERYSNKLINAFDGNYDTYWRSSGVQGEKYINYDTQIVYESLINNIIITFSHTVEINRMLYKAPYVNGKDGIGYPIKLSIYYKLKDINGIISENENDFLLFEEIISEQTGNLVLFTFEESITCDQIKIEWNELDTENDGYAYASEIMLFYPENKFLDKLIFDVFLPNDYTNLRISSQYNNLEIIDDLTEEFKEIYDHSDYVKDLVKRIKSIIKGELKYEPKREFSTNQNSKNNIIYQRGDTVGYSKNTLKMKWGGTDRQCTGIYGFPNEIIKIYVDCEENDIDRLPSIRFSQFLGSNSVGWLGNPIKLKKGINNLEVQKFDMRNFNIPTNPGGPIYIENKYTSLEQSEKIKIYIEGGILFPLFRKNENETEFKEFLSNYISEYENHIDTYLNITELYSDHIMITVSATVAYDIYVNKSKSPQANLLKWDERIEKFFTFDGIQLDESQPYYDIKNKYINIHLRYSQQKSNTVLAYATTEHIGIYLKYHLLDLVDSTEGIDNTIAHEIGHIIDVSPRIISEQTNNVITQLSEFLDKMYGASGDFKIASQPLIRDDVEIYLRGCRSKNTSECNGLFRNYDNYKLGYSYWWFIELMHFGYWGEMDNLYRFNISLISGMTKTEGMVYLTNYVVNSDMGYYFERIGFSFEKEKLFSIENSSEIYKLKMEELIKERNIDTSIKKKIWYYDLNQYYYMINIGKGCYEDKNKYNIKILNVTSFMNNKDKYHNISLPKIDCEGHLGFEIYENDKIIDFCYNNYYIDKNKYEEGYIPQYKIVAYDRLLQYTNPSEIEMPQNINQENLLNSKKWAFLKFLE